jgi:hypothetical protein
MLFLALALVAAEAPPAPPEPRPMSVDVTRDPINDRVNATATLYDARNRLDIACDPGRYDGLRVSFTSIYWLARGNVLTGERSVTYRFDDQRARRLYWHVESRSARIGDTRNRARPFIRELVSAERVVFRTRDVEEHPIDLTFRIHGARPAIAQLLDACGEDELKDRLFGASDS